MILSLDFMKIASDGGRIGRPVHDADGVRAREIPERVDGTVVDGARSGDHSVESRARQGGST